MRTIRTRNSTYVINEDAKTIARVEGKNPPTTAFAEDNIEHPYESVIYLGQSLLIEWPAGSKEHSHTRTSTVLADITA